MVEEVLFGMNVGFLVGVNALFGTVFGAMVEEEHCHTFQVTANFKTSVISYFLG